MLRLWLSLIIDFDGAAPPALPNLDFKIVCGDSLTAPNPQQAGTLFRDQVHQATDRLSRLKGRFLVETGPAKAALRRDIVTEEESIRSWTRHDVGVPAGCVDWRVDFAEVFDEKSGFDILIANPPYGARVTDDEKPFFKRQYEHSAVGKVDTYRLFIELASRLTRPRGSLVLVVPNTWLTMDRAVKLRRFVLENQSISSIVQLPQDVFGSTVDPIIFCASNSPGGPSIVSVRTLALRGGSDRLSAADWRYSGVADSKDWLGTPGAKILLRMDDRTSQLKAKVFEGRRKLGVAVTIRQGIIPYLTKADGQANAYIGSSKIDRNWYPYLDGSRCVAAFAIKGPISYIKYGDWLYAPRERSHFSGPRIVCQLIRNISLKRRLVGAYLEEEVFSDRNTGIIKMRPESDVDVLCLTGLFNSKLWSWLHFQIHTNTYINFKSIREMPLPEFSAGQKRKLSALVGKIIATKSAGAGRGDSLLNELDNVVYDLYGLAHDDTEFIDSYFELAD